MINAFYTGATGLNAFQESMDVIGNNIANVNTNGYKAVGTSFNDLLYSEMYVNTPNSPLVGHGVKATTKGIEAGQGITLPTSGKLDLAIAGRGWFALEAENGKLYTRDGSFAISLSGNTAYLVNKDGNYVLDAGGKRISATIDQKTTSIDTDALVKQIGIFEFAYPEALTPVSSNCYRANDFTGTATAAAQGDNTILVGYLEQSGVSITDEMANLITAQRGYQLSARVVQVADEIEQTVNSLRA